MISEPIAAACPEPIAGRNEHNGAEIAAQIVAFSISFFSNFIFLTVFCFGIFVFWIMLKTSPEPPNRPESKGSNGS